MIKQVVHSNSNRSGAHSPLKSWSLTEQNFICAYRNSLRGHTVTAQWDLNSGCSLSRAWRYSSSDATLLGDLCTWANGNISLMADWKLIPFADAEMLLLDVDVRMMQ